ncbi:UNVERIFIED_CONTAM: hypothetical protein FKN15_016817 [Acipenser sinensis]
MNKAIVVFLSLETLVNKIIEEGFSVNGAFISALPLSTPLRKVVLSNVPPFIPNAVIERELARYGKIMSPIRMIPQGCKNPEVKHVMSFRRQVFVLPHNPGQDLNVAWRFIIERKECVIFATSDTMKYFHYGEEGHMKQACPKLISAAAAEGSAERQGAGQAEGVWGAQVAEMPVPAGHMKQACPKLISAAAAEGSAERQGAGQAEGVWGAQVAEMPVPAP